MKTQKYKLWTLLFLVSLAFTTSCSTSDVTETQPEEASILNFTPSQMEFLAEGGTKGMQISSNTSWNLSSEVTWINLSETASEGTLNVKVTADPNEAYEQRNTSINIVSLDNNISGQMQIRQAEAEEPEPEIEAHIPPDNTGIRELTSVELSRDMGIGWNLGNSLEAVGGETAWGNPVVSKELIQAVKAAGFNTVRIPVAWSKFSNEENFTIRKEWKLRVEEVVNYVLESGMYAMINIHWDNGWIVPTYAQEDYVNKRLEAMWQQIAIHFRNYDDRLLFAGTNEVMVEGDYGTPTEEYYTVQNGYNQTFVNTIRATGGKNSFRHLVVQGFNTNIDHTLNFVKIPEDEIQNRLLMEVHYYDPFNFTLNESSSVYQWGEDAPESEVWANESYVDEQFNRMKTEFIDQGVGVILGEYGAIRRENVEEHESYRELYLDYITSSSLEHGLVPIYWDNGNTGNYGFAIFDRSSAEIVYPNILETLMK